jgi:hypothetical protein
MGFVVLHRFADLQDVTQTKSGALPYIYDIGEEYPRSGKKVSKNRLEELAGNYNTVGYPLIQYVEEEQPAEPAQTTPRKRKTK